ncbi:MAG: DHH family phosphoesterase, partial [Planctomycetota bacterium]
MSDYRTNATYPELAARLREAERVALITHERPDGDALGSVLALKRTLDRLGRASDVLLSGVLEEGLARVAEPTPLRQADRDPPGDDYDLVVVADTGAWSQVEAVADWLRPRHEQVIGFDHHRQGQPLAARRIVDAAAASTTVVLMPLIDELGVELTGEIGGIAEALFLGLATDTGWFRFSNADGPA